MPKLKRPCIECPWVIDHPFGFESPDQAQRFASDALRVAYHQCHMNTRQWCVCKGSKIFAAQALAQDDGTLDLSIKTYTPTLLIETAKDGFNTAKHA